MDFPEEDYESWLENDATPKQREVAMRIREEEIEGDEQPPTPTEKREDALRRFVNFFRRSQKGK